MHPKIKEQQQLMQQSLKLLDDIATIERLIHPVDPPTCKILVGELRCTYIASMSVLLSNLLKVSADEFQQ